MSINRRTAIRQLTCISAGADLSPSCLQDQSGKNVPYRNFHVEGREEKLMEQLTATLIPTTDTPGAKDVSAHLLVWRIMDDCASAGEKFMGISGNKDGLPHLADGEFLPPLELTCVESYFRDVVRSKYSRRQVICGRCAHLTEPASRVFLKQNPSQ